MSNVKTASSRLLAAILAVCLAAVMAVGAGVLLTPADSAYAAVNQKVLDQRAGVFKFNWGIDGQEYARGSAFLINEDTVVTAYHCVMPSSWELERYNLTAQDVQDRSTYTVTIAGDFQVPAKLEKFSEKQDMAILKLDQKLNNVKSLTLRDSSEVDASEVVYALGFPASADQNAVLTFTSNDVAVIDGTVTKPEGQMTYMTNTKQLCEGSFLMTSCRFENGSSGGPMVDAEGNVIGICVASDSSFYYAAASDILMQALDTMAYEYKKADATGGDESSSGAAPKAEEYTLSFAALDQAISAAEGLDSSKYTEDSFKAVKTALEAAKAAKDTKLDDPTDKEAYEKAQAEIDAAAKALTDATGALKDAPTGPDTGMIVAIVIAVIVVIAIIILIVVMRGRNKKTQENAPTVPLGGTPQVTGAAAQPALQSGGSQSWQKPGAAAPSAGAAETTILDEEASDTVILFQAASGGSLTRMSTNEQIPINSAEFTIGRERSKVNYCLEGNTSISRVHVRIVVRDGKVYCIDNKAANGTYINGVKCRPGEEVLLKSGDIITLADEKFKYNA